MLHVLKESLESSSYTYSLVSYIEALRCCPVIQQNKNPLLFHKRDAWAFAKSCNTESMIVEGTFKVSWALIPEKNYLIISARHLCLCLAKSDLLCLPFSATPPVIFNYHTTENWIHLALAGFLAYPPFFIIRKFSHCFEVLSPAQTDSSFRLVPLTHTLNRKGLQNYWCTRYELWLPISNVF